MKKRFSYHWLPTLMVCAFCTGVHAQSNIITYQGHLTDGSSPANGLYDLSFELFNDPSAGSSWGATTNTAVVVSNGLFTVLIDVGPGVFDGTGLWLEIGAVTNGGGSFTTLSPRQPITSAPYAIQAQNANLAGVAGAVSGSISSTQISGTLNESQLADNSVTSAKIANNTIIAADLAPASVNSSEIAPAAVGTSELANGSVTADKIGGVLLTSQIPDLDADKIATGTIDDGRLSANVALLDADQNFSGINSFDNTGNSFTGTFAGDGAGLTNIPGVLLPESTGDSSVQMVANRSYLATNAGISSFILPADPEVGTIVELSGLGGIWRIEPETGQEIAGYAPGEVWIARESNRSWKSIASSADGNILVAVVENGQIHVSCDRGYSWTAQDSNRNWRDVACSDDGSQMYAVVDGGYIYSSTDGGSNWMQRAYLTDWRAVDCSADGSRILASADNDQLALSTDGGTNWIEVSNSRDWTEVASSADGMRLFAADYGPLFVGGRIYGSVNGGTNWVTLSSFNQFWRSIACSADGTKLVAGTAIGLYTSVNGGTNWTVRLSSGNWADVVSSDDGNTLLAAYYGGALHTSFDSGTNWTARTQNRNWESVTSSGDGVRFAAVSSGGRVYTSDISIEGVAGQHVALQYAGEGVWNLISPLQDTDASPNSLVVRDESGGISIDSVEASAFIGNGAGLTGLNASQITSGTLSDSRLSSNIAKLNASQTFTAANTFSNALGNFSGSFSGDGGGLSGVADSHSLDASDGSPTDALFVDADADIGIGTTSPADPLHIRTSVGNNCAIRMVTGASWSLVMEQDDSSVFSIQNGGSKRFYLLSSGRVGIGISNPSERLHVSGNILATGTVTGSSDRNLKENFSSVNPQDVLAKVIGMPIQRWNYIGEDVPHVGPVAQDFHGAFQVGMDDKHISMVDADGIALAAIQGLNQKLEAKEAEIADLKARLDRLERLLEAQSTGGER